MGCTRRLVTNGVHAYLLLNVLGSLNATHVLLATTAHEEQLDILGETFGVLYLINTPCTTTERAYISELIRIGQCDLTGLHTTH